MIVESGLRDAAIDADWDELKSGRNPRLIAKPQYIQEECMRSGGSQALLRARLNAISDVCAQIIRELGQ
jgi:hypothetical protein